MVRITEDLIRKRAEHNEMEISTLEELSLHQQDIEKIEFLDKWCRELKILYLQSNLIEKIENVSRLKKLEYINLALNNIERIENLEGCESLEKLDLTVNFVGEVTSIETLQNLEFFRELYLTGNPCTDYEGYREYVVGTLPRLSRLDGTEIEKSERIKAVQNLPTVRLKVLDQQLQYTKKREKEKAEELRKAEQKKQPGFDGRWYTDIDGKGRNSQSKDCEEDENSDFWKEKVAFTPESRKQVHEHMQKTREKKEVSKFAQPEDAKPPRRLFGEDGQALNANEAKVNFTLTDDEEHNQFILDVETFKHMDTSLMDADVQPTYVRVLLKGKILQLRLDEEVNTDKSTAQRSTITGHLVITMPKAKPVIATPKPKSSATVNDNIKDLDKKVQKLEVDPTKQTSLDFGNIVQDKKVVSPLGARDFAIKLKERENSPDFVDDPDVPPLI